MLVIIIVALAVPAAALLWLLLQKSSYEVKRSQLVNVTAAQAFAYVRDFGTWPEWSPWLMHEADAKLVFNEPTEVGGGYSWDGRSIGAGSMRHKRINPSSSMQMELSFLRPFRSTASVTWLFQEQDAAQCRLTWTMSSKLPLHMRWLRPMLEKSLGLDFELGLALLAGKLDPNCEHPRIDFVGVCSLEAQQVISRPYSGSFADMSAVLPAKFTELLELAGDKLVGTPMVVYHKVDLKKRSTECVLALPVSSAPAGESLSEVAGGKYFKVRLTGGYQFLEHAWHSAINHLRLGKIKFNAKQPSLETYINAPHDVQSSNELITEILLPLPEK